MKSKCTYFFLFFIFLTVWEAHSQVVLNPDWVKIKSSALPNGNAEAWAIGADKSGNLLWGVNMDMNGLFEYMDALVYKLDENGTEIWLDTAVTGLFAQQTYNLKVTDSLVYLGGRTCRTIGTDSCDALIFTTETANGTTGWEFNWDGGYGYEEIDGIALENDGIILTGWSAGSTTKVDVLLMKLDYAGNLVWQTTWGSPGARDDHQDGHMVVDDSMIYIAGLYDGSPVLGWEGYALLAKFDKANGNFVDSAKFGRQDTWLNAENALGMATDGTYLYLTGYTTTSANNWDLFVVKFDKNLNEIWYKTWGGSPGTESARAIAVSNDGSIFIGGNTTSYGNGDIEAVLLKYDSSGNLQWFKTWGDTLDDQILDIYIDGKNLYITGKTNSFHPTQKWDALLLKVEIDSTTGLVEYTNKILPKAYFSPNPMSHSAMLHFDNPTGTPFQFLLYDILGRQVRAVKHISIDELIFEKGSLKSGIYFFQLHTSDQQMATGKLVIK